ncbi:MAG: SbcC/MukB-like Walker B domain-containing protein, partial [Oscillospiraceae bacterium]
GEENALREQQKRGYDQKKDLLQKRQQLFARLEHNRGILEEIQALVPKLREIEKKVQWLEALSNTAGGSMKGKQKINFETYVQINYFEVVIHAANRRFVQMTGGQYELLRRDDGDSRQTQSGLELDVLDRYKGTVRSVKTLSGGEAFKASLSLALGLADVIQAHAGGIKIDTMFVDEGFGSLDGESLELAVKILSDLSGGGRLVGIISHVAELKERIDKKIIVRKDGNPRVTIEI